MQSILVILLKSMGFGPANSVAQSDLSEELKLSIVTCFGAVLRKATPEVIKEFYTRDNLNLVAQILFLSEQIVAKEKYRPLRYKYPKDIMIFHFFPLKLLHFYIVEFKFSRIAGIDCITSVYQVHNDSHVSDTKQRQQVADLVFLMIPKIVATLLKVTTESSDTLITVIICTLATYSIFNSSFVFI